MDRAQRQAEQHAKYAAMSRPRKVALLLTAVLAAGVTGLLVSYVLSGEWRIGLAIATGLAVAASQAFIFRDTW